MTPRTSVLKHKIVDLVRQRCGRVSLDAGSDGEEDSAPAVCQALNISEQNLFVRLHRARKVLMQAA